MWQTLGTQYSEQCALTNIPPEECSLTTKLIDDYRGADMFWLVTISICFLLSQVLRSARWVILLKPLGYQISQFNSFATLMVGYFANLAAPRLGEFVRAGLINRYEKIPVEKAFATIVIGRVVDLIMFAIMIILGLIFHYDELWGYITTNIRYSTTSLTIFLAIMAIIGVASLFVLSKLLKMNPDRLPTFAAKIQGIGKSFVQAIKDVRGLPNKFLFIAYSIGIWLMYYLMHYLAFFSFEPVSHLSPANGLLVFDLGTLGILFPSQGGLGSYHFMIVEALKIFDVDPLDGMSFAMITFFTLTIFCTVLIGLISLILLPIVNRVNSPVEKK